MATEAVLKRQKDKNGKATGFYVCSLCDERFKVNPADKGEMTRTFTHHIGVAHKPKKPR